jgi:hypothetical protein
VALAVALGVTLGVALAVALGGTLGVALAVALGGALGVALAVAGGVCVGLGIAVSEDVGLGGVMAALSFPHAASQVIIAPSAIALAGVVRLRTAARARSSMGCLLRR